MNKKEITEYNKRCATFLGAIYSEHAKAWGFINAKNIGSKMFDGIMYHNVIEAERFKTELKFHSDWNWIMEVIEAIEKLGFATKIDHNYCISNYGCDRCEIDTKENALFQDCDEEEESIASELTKSKKIATTEAINQFLIWYNEQKK